MGCLASVYLTYQKVAGKSMSSKKLLFATLLFLSNYYNLIEAATPTGIGLSDPRQSAAVNIVSSNNDAGGESGEKSFLAHGFAGITLASPTTSAKANAETRLINKWLSNRASGGSQTYIGRPRMNHSETVELGLGFGIYRLGEVDENLQTVSIHGWTIMKWRDDSVVWKPAEFEQLNYISLPQNLIWKPDIALFNGASRDNIVNIFGDTNIIVSSRGNITWVPPTTVRVPFESDFSTWPDDHHRVQLQFGAWSHDASQVSVMPVNNAINQSLVADRSSYVENDRWRLISFTARRYVQFYECCPDMPWPSMIFEIEFERRPNFLSHVVDWPLKIVFAASCLVFALAVESPVRLLFCMLQLVCYTIFINLLLAIIPASAVYGQVLPAPLRHVICAFAMVFFEMIIVVCIQQIAEATCKFPLLLENILSSVGWLVGIAPLSQFTHLRHVNDVEDSDIGEPPAAQQPVVYTTLSAANAAAGNGAAVRGGRHTPQPPFDDDDDETAGGDLAHPYGNAAGRNNSVLDAGRRSASRRSGENITSNNNNNVVLSVDERHKNNRQWRLLAIFLNRIALMISVVVVAIVLI